MSFKFCLNKYVKPPVKPIYVSEAFTPRDRPKNGLFKCECGKEFVTRIRNVDKGLTRSCGCYNKRVASITNLRHGHSKRVDKSATYVSWENMIQRCSNTERRDYQWYGGRGIKVCKRWLLFENFLEDIGEKTKGFTIERIDNEKGYEPSNCIWISPKQQQINKVTTVYVIHSGTKTPLLSVYQDAKVDISYTTVLNRVVQYKWSVERALNTPVTRRNKKCP